jgi:hypothetical protein
VKPDGEANVDVEPDGVSVVDTDDFGSVLPHGVSG